MRVGRHARPDEQAARSESGYAREGPHGVQPWHLPGAGQVVQMRLRKQWGAGLGSKHAARRMKSGLSCPGSAALANAVPPPHARRQLASLTTHKQRHGFCVALGAACMGALLAAAAALEPDCAGTHRCAGLHLAGRGQRRRGCRCRAGRGAVGAGRGCAMPSRRCRRGRHPQRTRDKPGGQAGSWALLRAAPSSAHLPAIPARHLAPRAGRGRAWAGSGPRAGLLQKERWGAGRADGC